MTDHAFQYNSELNAYAFKVVYSDTYEIICIQSYICIGKGGVQTFFRHTSTFKPPIIQPMVW